MRFSFLLLFAIFAAGLDGFGDEAAPRFAPIDLSESAALASLDTRSLQEGLSQNKNPNDNDQGKDQPTEVSPGQDAKPKQEPITPEDQASPSYNPQPKRILGIMPNFRAVSAGTIPPPPTPQKAFIIATQNSFDYSSFIFVAITSMLAEGTNNHPQLGKGVAGFGRYYWRGFADKTDGNYWVIFILPTVFRQDERYYALGRGSIPKRLLYAVSRILVTPNYHGRLGINVSELAGRGISQGISLEYYPSQTRTAGAIASKYAYAIGRDALTNMVREMWPDIAAHILHRHP